MKNVRLAVMIALFVALMSGLALGQQPQHPVQAPVDLDRLVSLDVNAVEPAKVFAMLAQSIGCELALDERVNQPVTLVASNIRTRTALDAICESIGCRWEIDGRTLGVQPGTGPSWQTVIRRNREVFDRMATPLPAGFRFSDVAADSVLEALTKETGIEIVAPDLDLSKRVTVDLSVKTPWDAIHSVFQAAGLTRVRAVVEGPDKGAGTIRIVVGYPAVPRQADATRIYDEDDPAIKKPVAERHFRAAYTAEALRAKQQGKVVLSAVVLPDGTVGDVTVLTPLFNSLDLEAIKAARQWRFEPGTKDGKPVPVRVKLTFDFSVR